jgi:hypothetical protein
MEGIFYLRSFRGPSIHFNLSDSEFNFFEFFKWFHIVYTKVVAHNVIHKFVVHNIIIWDSLEAQIFVLI